MNFDGWTLEETIAYVLAHRTEGVVCPCCDIPLKVWPESIGRTMVFQLAALCELFFQGDREWYHTREFAVKGASTSGGRFTIFRHYGFVENGDPGMWKPKSRGHRWLLNKISVPRYALILDKDCLGFEGEKWTVHDAFKEKFDLQKMRDYPIQSDV